LSALFLSHGSPLLVLEETATTRFLRGLGRRLPPPLAVVAVSAHWLTARPRVGGAARPATLHDFYGFPPDLYQRRYPAPGAPELAGRLAAALGGTAAVDPERGFDHGVWSVASLLWPEATVPIVPLSLQPDAAPEALFALGRRLRAALAPGMLVLGSGSLTHNLAAYAGHRVDDPAEPWVTAFAEWVADTLAAGDHAALFEYRRRAPAAERNHPSDEHLLPLFVALGAAETAMAVPLHRATEYGVIAMDAYGFA